MIVNANCVLRKSRVLVRVRMRDGGTEALKIIVWHLVRVSTQRRKFQAAFHRLKGERIHFDWVENVLPAEQRWKVVVDPCEQRVAAEFPGVALAIQTNGFRKVGAMLTSLPRQDGRPAKAIDDSRNARDRIGRVAARILQIA